MVSGLVPSETAADNAAAALAAAGMTSHGNPDTIKECLKSAKIMAALITYSQNNDNSSPLEPFVMSFLNITD